MGSRRSSSKRKLKRDKISSKKNSRKESKKHRRRYDSVSSSSDDDSLHLEHSLSTSKFDHKRTTRTKKRRRDSSLSSYSDYQSVSSDSDSYKRRTARSKKRRRDSSLSSYSDYQSVSSDSDSSSTDDNDYKVRKARRSRVGPKDTKRKVRKKSTSSIGDEYAFGGRKRKRIDRDHDIKPKMKSSKKKPKKNLSSSSDSDSESCSACQTRSSNSRGGDAHRRKRVVSDMEKGRLRSRGSDKGKKKHKARSPSCNLIGRGGNSGFIEPKSDEEIFPVDYSRRLRSVITVVDQPEKDPHKEEIVYDQNDYPSPKSLDSNEDGTKIDSDNQFSVAFRDTIYTEDIADEEVCELEKSGIDKGDHSNSNAGDRQSGGSTNNSEEKEIDKSVPVVASGGDVLESILRQKALENLKKFRERPQACPRSNIMKINNKANVLSLSDGTLDTIPNESTEQGSSSAQEMNQGSGLLLQRETAEVVKIPDSKKVEKKPGLTKLNSTHSGNDAAQLQYSEEDQSAGSCSVLAESLPGSNTSHETGGSKACSSSNVEPTSTEPNSGEHSVKQTNEANEDSQFQQKTMSVMRGGELVQVSYKVKIPNKSHALARRQLRR